MVQSAKSFLGLFIVSIFIASAAIIIYLGASGTFNNSHKIGSVEPATVTHIKGDENLVPHKALYEIKLFSKKSGSQVLNISGKMFYEWEKTCGGWLTDHNFDMLYEYADSPSMRVTSNFSTYEGFDSQTLDFTMERKSNGQVFEKIRGSANSQEATYTLPTDDLNFTFDDDTFFPIAHTAAVVNQIKANQKFMSATLFDGSDTEGPLIVSSFVGSKAAAPEGLLTQKDIDKSLLDAPAHKLRLAFFPLKSEQAEADYEMDMVFHENGVISDMHVYYDDFAVSQSLVALQVSEDSCVDSMETKE